MKCPNCKIVTLEFDYLERNLPCRTCSDCKGHWLLLEDFIHWKQLLNQDNNLINDDESEINIKEVIDTKHALLCPISGNLMTKFRITKDTEHRLDISPTTGGIWLDKGEWELLKKFNLAIRLNQVFTASWQNKIRAEVTKDRLENLYKKRFGEDDYNKLKTLREWINQHPEKENIKSFIISNDPWSV